ncbi:MAG: hemolysin III family protein [Gaiella sp.]
MSDLEPRLRGVFHLVGFVASVAAGIVLGVLADRGRENLASWLYVGSLAAMFGCSALYHRYPWKTGAGRAWARRVDHSTIFLFIAGSYTPFLLLSFEGKFPVVLLIVVWSGAGLGIILNLAWIDAPRWLTAGVYLALGWGGIALVPRLFTDVGVAPGVLVVIGGGLYTVGALAYAARRPNPIPAWVGFHEVFHVLVLAAAVVQFVAVSLVVL